MGGWCSIGVPRAPQGGIVEVFPNIYRVAHAKDALLAENLKIYSDFLQWNISFIEEVQGWGGFFSEFFNLFYSTRLRREGEDKIL